ncbi:MAG: hypothetical protein QM527_04370 [Alphaproteobacteria bacterium]|nr:hypothetical protein [Alphaproteobacteria bacterium]
MPQALVIHADRDVRVEDWPTGRPQTGQLRVHLLAGGICRSDLRCSNP